MRKRFAVISLMILFSFSSAHANYGQLKRALESYEPPQAFLNPDRDGEVQNNFVSFSPGPSQRQGITVSKRNLGKKLARLGRDRIDPDTYQRMSKLTFNINALEKHISQNIRLEEIKAAALLRNPQIRAAREKVYAQIQTFDQVMNLDNSLRRYNAFTKSINNPVGPLKKKASIKMNFPSPGLSALKGRIVEDQVSVTIEKAAVTVKNVLRDVETVFWDLVFIHQSIGITQETIAAFERLRGGATALYRSGQTSYQDVIKINIKIEELKEDLATLASRKETAAVRMVELLSIPHVRIKKIEVPVLPARLPRVDQLYRLARENRQELIALRYQIAKVSSMVEMAETMTEARPTLGFSTYEADFVNTAGTGAPRSGFTAKTMPAMKNNRPNQAWYGINEPWLEQTRQTLASLKSTLTAKENATDTMVRKEWFKADKNNREHLLYQQRILPMAKSALDVTTREYEAGSIPFSQAIDSYTYWLKVKLIIAREKSDFAISFAELENITGKPLR